MKTLATIALTTMLLAAAAQVARAQICAGSHFNYVVRDAKGAIVDASGKDVRFEDDGSHEYDRKWSTGKMSVERMSGTDLPPKISEFDGKIVLLNRGMCVFKNDLRLRVTLGNKTMKLVFHIPQLSEYDSRDFVVDSVPFAAGSYEITLTVPPRGHLNYYPASSWKKVVAKP